MDVKAILRRAADLCVERHARPQSDDDRGQFRILQMRPTEEGIFTARSSSLAGRQAVLHRARSVWR
jgi:hypothetical protein